MEAELQNYQIADFALKASYEALGQTMADQLKKHLFNRADVQELLKKVTVHTGFPLHEPVKVAGMLDPYTRAYPDKMKTSVVIMLKDGRTLEKEQDDYYGFWTRPFSWEYTIQKFKRLSSDSIDEAPGSNK